MHRTIRLFGLLILTTVICQAEIARKPFELITQEDVTLLKKGKATVVGPIPYTEPKIFQEMLQFIEANPRPDDPKVILVSPSQGEVVSRPFELKIKFEGGAGRTIDPSSVLVVYNAAMRVTSRLENYIRPEGIEISNVTVPPGEHNLRVFVRDSAGRGGKLYFYLKVRE